MTSTTGEGLWSVIFEGGGACVVMVRLTHAVPPHQWRATCAANGGTAVGPTPRAAIQAIVRMAAWVPVEILAPGEKTRAELEAEQDVLRSAVRSFLAARYILGCGDEPAIVTLRALVQAGDAAGRDGR